MSPPTPNPKKENTSMTATLSELIDRHRIDVLDHHDREISVPICHGLQRQGDVLVRPTPYQQEKATTPVPSQGVPVVRGEAGGNTHAIVADGDAWCDLVDPSPTNLLLATLTVADGAIAYLTHPEHSYQGIGPGTYELRRQREQADELRLVTD